MQKYKAKYTNIFLVDKLQPTKFLLLKRGSWREFAPNLYTGMGGRFEEGETPLECAKRELREESGLDYIRLKEIAGIIINGEKSVCEFVGEYSGEAPKCNEGDLEWVSLGELFQKDFIPTSKILLQEWKKRNWSILNPFTLFIERENMEDIHSKIISIEIKEGLF